MGCTNLSFVELPENISSIEWATFAGCTSIESITIPNTVETIEEGAFSGCILDFFFTTAKLNLCTCFQIIEFKKGIQTGAFIHRDKKCGLVFEV